MSKSNKVGYFLNEINSKETKQTFELLKSIVEDLEVKNDPDPIEIEIVSNAYQILEKINLLNDLMRKYNISKVSLDGSFLNNLYKTN